MKIKKNIVLKIGTTSIIKDELLNTEFIDSLAKSVKFLKEEGINTIIVTSGAVQLGANDTGCPDYPWISALHIVYYILIRFID